MHVPRADSSDVHHGRGRGSGDRHCQPDQGRKREAGERGQFQDQGVMRSEVVDHSKGQQENSR